MPFSSVGATLLCVLIACGAPEQRPGATSSEAGSPQSTASADVVAWDAEHLFPDLQSTFGDLVIPVVMAHEWGHAIQARSGFTARTVTRELQADCFAGAWTKHAQRDGGFDISDADLDRALAKHPGPA